MPQDLRYPVGPFQRTNQLTPAERSAATDAIAEAPAKLRAAVKGLTADQLATPYRPGGWTVRQVVHHLPDSHLNAYTRFKLALTEDQPQIKTYQEARWAELVDGKDASVETSLNLLEALHERWVMLLRSLKPEDYARKLEHPELGLINLDFLLAMYSWHGRHHVAHITALRERMGWG
jgi:hypothetical protein